MFIAAAVLVELHLAVHEGEQRPIAAGADVLARDKFGAALADEDAAGGDELRRQILSRPAVC